MWEERREAQQRYFIEFEEGIFLFSEPPKFYVPLN